MKTKFDNLQNCGNDGKPLIVITNDDGVDAKGFASLIEALQPYGDILAIAPDSGKSGMSHALTFKQPVRMHCIEHSERLRIFKLSGTPVDCVKMALDRLIDRKPALLVSGINHGANSSISSIYSGTVAAAREGGLNGIPSVAFSSLDFSSDAEFRPFIPYIKAVVDNIFAKGIMPNTFLNVNFPHQDIENIKGIKACRQAKGVWVEEFLRREDPLGLEYFWLTGYFSNHEPDATDTDEYWLTQNYITLVPIMIEVTANEAIHKLQSWETGNKA